MSLVNILRQSACMSVGVLNGKYRKSRTKWNQFWRNFIRSLCLCCFASCWFRLRRQSTVFISLEMFVMRKNTSWTIHLRQILVFITFWWFIIVIIRSHQVVSRTVLRVRRHNPCGFIFDSLIRFNNQKWTSSNDRWHRIFYELFYDLNGQSEKSARP